jgi:hypothetical protein
MVRGIIEHVEERIGKLETALYRLEEIHTEPTITARDPIGDGMLICYNEITQVDMAALDRRGRKWHRPHYKNYLDGLSKTVEGRSIAALHFDVLKD